MQIVNCSASICQITNNCFLAPIEAIVYAGPWQPSHHYRTAARQPQTTAVSLFPDISGQFVIFFGNHGQRTQTGARQLTSTTALSFC